MCADKLLFPLAEMFPVGYGLSQQLDPEEYKTSQEAFLKKGLMGLYKFHHQRKIGESEYHDLLEKKLPTKPKEEEEDKKEDDEAEIIAQRERNRQPRGQQESVINRGQYQRLPQQDDEVMEQEAIANLNALRQPPDEEQIRSGEAAQRERIEQIRRRQEEIDSQRPRRTNIREYLPNLSTSEMRIIDRAILGMTSYLSQSHYSNDSGLGNLIPVPIDEGDEILVGEKRWKSWTPEEKEQAIKYEKEADQLPQYCRRFIDFDADGKLVSQVICTGKEGNSKGEKIYTE